MNDRKDKLNTLMIFICSLDEPEVFKEITFIDGAKGKYFVSDKGRILSLCNNEPRILKAYVCGNQYNKGYRKVSICGKDRKISRLVALAFLPCDDNSKMVVDHINEDKHDDRLSNLQWVTQKENVTLHYERLKQEQ